MKRAVVYTSRKLQLIRAKWCFGQVRCGYLDYGELIFYFKIWNKRCMIFIHYYFNCVCGLRINVTAKLFLNHWVLNDQIAIDVRTRWEDKFRYINHIYGWMFKHDDVIKWKHLSRCRPFVRKIRRSSVNSPYKGQWREALMFSLICAWTKCWANNRDAGGLKRHRAHYDVTVVRLTHSYGYLDTTASLLSHATKFNFLSSDSMDTAILNHWCLTEL